MKRAALEYLKVWANNQKSKPLIIRGARQVGKSTLVRLFCENQGLDLIEINLEKIKIKEFENQTSFSIQKVISDIELASNKVLGPNTILFIDEIQAQPQAFAKLRYFYEDAAEVRVVAAGSLLDVIIDEANFSIPVGRVEYYFLGPMTFTEFLQARNEEILIKQLKNLDINSYVGEALHERMIAQLKDYYFVGGMPEAVKTFIETNDRSKVRKVQLDLLQTYRDDIPKYTKGKFNLRVKEVFEYVPANLGASKVKFSDIFESNSLQVKQAIDLLHRAQVILKVLHTSASGLPLTAGADPSVMKLFFLDIGLYNAVMGVQWANIYSTQEGELLTKGNMAEQFIAQHLATLNPHIRNELYYWLRGGKAQAAEVDFIFAHNGSIYPIEVKAGSTGKMRSLWQFLGEKKQTKAIKFDLKIRDKCLQQASQIVVIENKKIEVKTSLISLPLYAIELFTRVIDSFENQVNKKKS